MTVTRRRFFQLGAAAAALCGATRSSHASATKVTMTHAFTAANQEMLMALIQAFHAQNSGVEITPILAGDNWSPLLQATLRAGLIGDLPDISHQSLTFTGILKKNGFAQPLDDLLGGQAGIARIGIPSSMLRPIDGRLYSLPFGTSLPVIYLNRDLLAKAGMDADKLPRSWPEIFEAMQRVSALGQSAVGGYIEYNADNGWIFQNLVASMGGKILTADASDIAFAGNEGLEALRLMKQFGAAAGKADMTRDQARQAFNSGSLGVLVRSASGIQPVAQAAAGKFALAVVNFPILAPSGHLVGAGHGITIFTKDGATQQAAVEYLKFATSPAGQAVLADKTGYLPVNLAALADKTYFADYFEKNPYHKTLVEALQTATDWETFDNNSKKIFDSWVEEMRQVVVQEKEPEAALAAMADSARMLMAQKGQRGPTVTDMPDER